jgi:hypothetical protein
VEVPGELAGILAVGDLVDVSVGNLAGRRRIDHIARRAVAVGKQASYPDSPAAVADYLARIKLQADAAYRLQAGLNSAGAGSLWMGDGTNPFDVRLYRAAAATLGVDDAAGTLATLQAAGIAFPTVQVPSADPNTLDDYEEGTWTPSLTCGTPGDLAVVYSVQSGRYTKIGRLVYYVGDVTTTTWTWTAGSGATGNLQMAGLPFASSGMVSIGQAEVRFTRAGYTHLSAIVSTGTSAVLFQAVGSGVAIVNLQIADAPSGTQLANTRVSGFYIA